MKRLACAVVLAGSAYAVAASPVEARANPSWSASNLELSIITPDPGSIGDRISLDVSFRGSTIETVELLLDGDLVAKKQINTSEARGVITFSLDTIRLSEGVHTVQVVATAPGGEVVRSTAKLKIPAIDLNAPVRIAYPQSGLQVSGVVPIKVRLGEDVQRQKPYVTFFVDKQLKELRNFPPYEYNWDTTRVPNGWHVIEAWTQTPDAISPIKARPVSVNVNNPSGDTNKQDTIQDLREVTPKRTPQITLPSPTLPVAKQPVHTVVPPVDPSTALTGARESLPAITGLRTHAIANNIRPRATSEPIPQIPLDRFGYGLTAMPLTSLPGPGGHLAPLASRFMMGRAVGNAAVEPRGHFSRRVVARTDRPMRFPTPALPYLPGMVAPHVRSTALAAPPLRAASQKSLHVNGLMIRPRGAFQVAFDGQQIAFDVPPRVEGGVRLAPFRQIFEHTGGRLYWFGGTAQTVRAVNSSREIELKIGSLSALVNNTAINMDRAPYIDGGRTIVPLTFIRDALDVVVSYDDKTGNLLIRSRK